MTRRSGPLCSVGMGCDRHANSTANWKNSSDFPTFLRNHTEQQVSIAPTVQTLFASFFPWNIAVRRKQQQINVESGKAISMLPPAGLALSIVLSMGRGVWAMEVGVMCIRGAGCLWATQMSCSRAVGAVAQGLSTVLIFPCSLWEECWQET